MGSQVRLHIIISDIGRKKSAQSENQDATVQTLTGRACRGHAFLLVAGRLPWLPWGWSGGLPISVDAGKPSRAHRAQRRVGYEALPRSLRSLPRLAAGR